MPTDALAEQNVPQSEELAPPAPREPCMCVSCMQGRARTLAYLLPGIDITERLSRVFEHGTEAEKAQLLQLLGVAT